MLTAEEARRLFSYDSETGVLTWKKRVASRVHIGDEVGYLSQIGYRKTEFRGENFNVHRIIMLIVNGEFPADEVDHINGCRSDNRLVNLRLATRTENCRNISLSNGNKSGCYGVSFYAKTNRWLARISIGGKEIYLGYFKEKRSAIEARKKAEVEFGFHENHGKVRDKISHVMKVFPQATVSKHCSNKPQSDS